MDSFLRCYAPPMLLLVATTALCGQVERANSGPVASARAEEASNAQVIVKESAIPPQVQTLSGQLVYHDGIRKWSELERDRAQSGRSSIQLVPAIADSRQSEVWKQIEVLRGCRVRTNGATFLSPINDDYYSLDITQSVQHIESIGTCTSKPPIHVKSNGKTDKNIQDYKVDMLVNYSPGDHPVVFHVTSAGKELQPWQAYASYTPPSHFVLYGRCGDGFVIGKVFGIPEAKPSRVLRDSMYVAMFNSESAVSSGNTDLHFGYTCLREP